MNTDIRIDVGFLDHWKTDTIIAGCGADGVLSLMRIWVFTAQNKPDGRLVGIKAEAIERIAKWRGEPGKLLSALVELHFLEQDGDGTWCVHDWENHQPEAMRRYRYVQSGGYDENGKRIFPQDWQEIKALVYRRDGRLCQYCGSAEGPFHADHVIPRIKGGPDTIDNLVVACAPCNTRKGSKTVSEWLGVAL